MQNITFWKNHHLFFLCLHFCLFSIFWFFWLDFTHRWHEEQQKNWNENFNFRLSSALFGFALKTITFVKLKDIHSYIYTITRHYTFFQGTFKIFGSFSCISYKIWKDLVLVTKELNYKLVFYGKRYFTDLT